MLSLNTIKSDAWSRKTSKRLGRWNGSGKGTYCGRGCNGQNSRSWGWVPTWFEWGQTPLFRRMPKLKGFTNARFKTEYNTLNIKDVEKLAKAGITEINEEVLFENKILRKKNFNRSLPIKLLWDGELTVKVSISVNEVTAGAKEKVEKAWGEIKKI